MMSQCATSWPEEHTMVLVNLKCKYSKEHDFGRSIQNLHWYENMSKRLAEVGIKQMAIKCGEHIKKLKCAYCKIKKSSNTPPTCSYYKEFNHRPRTFHHCWTKAEAQASLGEARGGKD
ncbi:unnamed protein product [Natator depressus]